MFFFSIIIFLKNVFVPFLLLLKFLEEHLATQLIIFVTQTIFLDSQKWHFLPESCQSKFSNSTNPNKTISQFWLKQKLLFEIDLNFLARVGLMWAYRIPPRWGRWHVHMLHVPIDLSVQVQRLILSYSILYVFCRWKRGTFEQWLNFKIFVWKSTSKAKLSIAWANEYATK